MVSRKVFDSILTTPTALCLGQTHTSRISTAIHYKIKIFPLFKVLFLIIVFPHILTILLRQLNRDLRLTNMTISSGAYEVSSASYEKTDLETHELEHAQLKTEALEHGHDMPLAGHDDGKLTEEVVLAYFTLCCQINAYIMTLLVPGAMLTSINAELGPNNNYVWITLSWPLGASVLVSIGGRLSDIFGRRYFMIVGALISIAGTLVGANGKSIGMMIVSGALFGIGSGFQELCYACAQEIVPNRYRVMAVGGLDTSLALAFSSPVVAYAIVAHYPSVGWRGAYWYLFAFHMFAFAMLVLFYRPPDYAMKHRNDGKTRWQMLGELDYIGVLLFLAGGVLFLLGINFGGRTYPWKSAGTIAPIVLGICCFIAVGLWCAYANLKYPLFPPKLFRRVRE